MQQLLNFIFGFTLFLEVYQEIELVHLYFELLYPGIVTTMSTVYFDRLLQMFFHFLIIKN